MKKHYHAFTLIELLLGLSIFALIALSVYSVFWGGMRLTRKAQRQNPVYREMRLTMDLMSRELENMVNYDFTGSYPDKFAVMGANKEVTFILDSDDGLKAVSYFLIAPDYGSIHKTIIGNTYSKNVTVTTKSIKSTPVQYLVRREALFSDYLSGNQEDVQTEVISTHIKKNGLRISYKNLIEVDGVLESSWGSSWEFPHVPGHVRVELDFVSEHGNGGELTFTWDILIPTGALFKEET